ncbi:MAG: 50S ribosomal protein L10 [Firmicutes bacterium]|nr:50S ribosomal protein L10 [Bacillota bacterium]
MSSASVLEAKQKIVAEIADRFERASAVVLTDYRGLDVAEVTELRRQLREAGVEFKVLKNTLTKFAAEQAGLDGLKDELVGPTAIAFSYEDPVAPARILSKYAKEHKKPALKIGVVEGKIIDAAGISALADLPSREVLLAQVLSGFQAPVSGFVNVLQGNLRNFAGVIDAIREQKETN